MTRFAGMEMLERETEKMVAENEALKKAVEDLKEKIETETVAKPKSCTYCKNFVQHYRKEGNQYYKVYCGHCVAGKPRRKKERKPDETCEFFEFGSYGSRAWI